MWKGGFELEMETMFEQSKRFYEGDNTVANPDNMRMYEATWSPGITYGVTRDFAVKAEFPFMYGVMTGESMGRHSLLSIGNWEVGAAYRIDPLIFGGPLVFEGGSCQLRLFGKAELPTAPERENGISFGEETFTFLGGGAIAIGTARHYFWGEVSGDISTEKDGTGMGPALQSHAAYAWRIQELKDYRELDIILLFELDVEARSKGTMNGDDDPDSGHFTTYLGSGVQVNFTNLISLKTGYNVPLYRRYNGVQLADDGTFMLMFSYLF